MSVVVEQPGRATSLALPDVKGTFLQAVSALADAPLTDIAERLREALLPYVGSTALVIFTEDCTGRPQKKAGEEEIISRVSIGELERLRASLPSDNPWQGDAEIAGAPRAVLAVKFSLSNALLVITDPHPAEGTAQDSPVALVEYLWQIAARRIQEKVADAPPSYLIESRAASAERLRVTAELVDLHSTTLETLLAALRSPSLDHASARSTVTDLAARALVALRTVSDRTTDLVEEPVAMAFERLQEDLRPLTRFSGVNVQFIEPPLNGRALPGEVAHAARAVVRGLVLAMIEQPEVRRIRAQWDCDGENLLINVRDDGQGALSTDATNIERLERRVQVLAGSMQIDVMPGWGADVAVTLPLNAPASPPGDATGWNLAAREMEVLQHMAAGKRNRSIASALNISENTVKFHVRNLFKKLDVRSRTEAIALAHSHGVR
ncbi:LuxR C-terminal-related transcriptional regulator [Pseudarthrobacter sp. J1763]|uniref:helix-turn-helix transcriptional regulator n=1 Tax=Pseudarthrobacter sp. J1763 TaxID=3420445 RepID=UPI003D270851